MNNIETLRTRLRNNLNNKSEGVYCVCSSHREVLKATLQFTREKNYPLIIESTSNQVNQYGGYTGMNAEDFIRYVHTLADEQDYPKHMIIFGGDHLGPNVWRSETSKVAMEKSKTLVASYIRAGYRKIHLDASMACADDDSIPGKGIGDALVAQRTAELCAVAEMEWEKLNDDTEKPVYIIGTEVPVPGGSQENEEHITPTSPESAMHTYEITKMAFEKQGLDLVWNRVIAMVVQPGVEFSDDHIFFYNDKKSVTLSELAQTFHIIFEAHSTDYQKTNGLKNLVQNHFAILKVGPWLTYAYREAIIALAHIESTLYSFGKISNPPTNIAEFLQQFLKNNPEHWMKYYHGTDSDKAFKSIFSLSDRIRYYWNREEIELKVNNLLENLGSHPLPFTLVSQYFPHLVEKLSLQQMTSKNIIHQHIIFTLEKYDIAINPN